MPKPLASVNPARQRFEIAAIRVNAILVAISALPLNSFSQGPLNGGVSNGGVSRSGLVLPFLSLFVLFGTFPIFLGFSRFARGWSGDFPDLSFSSFSAY